jgi:predicted nucleic acid-binding protein
VIGDLPAPVLTGNIAGDIMMIVRLFVLDTDVMVAAVRSRRGASRQLLLEAFRRRFQLLLSVPLVLEYEAVLTRAEHLGASEMTSSEMQVLLHTVVDVGVRVRPSFRWRLELPDPNDSLVLEAAINGGADAVVTFNVRHFAKVSENFGIDIISPRQALAEIRKVNSRATE